MAREQITQKALPQSGVEDNVPKTYINLSMSALGDIDTMFIPIQDPQGTHSHAFGIEYNPGAIPNVEQIRDGQQMHQLMAFVVIMLRLWFTPKRSGLVTPTSVLDIDPLVDTVGRIRQITRKDILCFMPTAKLHEADWLAYIINTAHQYRPQLDLNTIYLALYLWRSIQEFNIKRDSPTRKGKKEPDITQITNQMNTWLSADRDHSLSKYFSSLEDILGSVLALPLEHRPDLYGLVDQNALPVMLAYALHPEFYPMLEVSHHMVLEVDNFHVIQLFLRNDLMIFSNNQSNPIMGIDWKGSVESMHELTELQMLIWAHSIHTTHLPELTRMVVQKSKPSTKGRVPESVYTKNPLEVLQYTDLTRIYTGIPNNTATTTREQFVGSPFAHIRNLSGYWNVQKFPDYPIHEHTLSIFTPPEIMEIFYGIAAQYPEDRYPFDQMAWYQKEARKAAPNTSYPKHLKEFPIDPNSVPGYPILPTQLPLFES